MGDFNAKYNDWNPNRRSASLHICDCHGLWLTQFCDRNGLQVHPPMGCTFRTISTIDLFFGNSVTSVSYDGKPGLDHVAVIARLEVDKPTDMIRQRPAWRNIPASGCDDILEHVDSGRDEEMWLRLRSDVDAIRSSGRQVGQCRFWNPNLQRIRADLNRMRWIKQRWPIVSDDYIVV